MEIYKIIKKFENYEISNFGNVKNIKTGRILKPVINSNGYLQVILSKDKKKYTHYVHRLLAQNFIPNPNNKLCIDHINNDKLDNSLTNLRWASFSENNRNKSMYKNNTSGIKGVSWSKISNKWQVQLNNKHFGFYETKEEAIKVRKEKANEINGEFVNSSEVIEAQGVVIEAQANLINIQAKIIKKQNIIIVDDLEDLELEFNNIGK